MAALVTGALFGAVADHFGANVVLAPFCVTFAMFVSVSITDLTHRLVPRWILYASLTLIVPLLLVTSAVDHRWYSLTGSVIAGAVAFGSSSPCGGSSPAGWDSATCGLAGAIGFVVGYLSILHAYVAFLAGFLVGMVFGLLILIIDPIRSQDDPPLRSIAVRGSHHRHPVGLPDRPRALPHVLTSGMTGLRRTVPCAARCRPPGRPTHPE